MIYIGSDVFNSKNNNWSKPVPYWKRNTMKRYVCGWFCFVTTFHSPIHWLTKWISFLFFLSIFHISLAVQWGAQTIWKCTEPTSISAMQRIQSENTWMLQSKFRAAAQLCQRSQRFYKLHPKSSDQITKRKTNTNCKTRYHCCCCFVNDEDSSNLFIKWKQQNKTIVCRIVCAKQRLNCEYKKLNKFNFYWKKTNSIIRWTTKFGRNAKIVQTSICCCCCSSAICTV